MRAGLISVMLVMASGQVVDAATMDQIVRNCARAQDQLTEVALSDQAMALQLTRNYHHILENMLMPMNERLIRNGRFVEPLVRTSSEVAATIVEWEEDVTSYINKLQTLRAVNCVTEPEMFAAGLSDTRAARAWLVLQNQQMLDLLTEYQAALPAIWESDI
ncbi:hypothetical protein FWH13_00685 [Candidatus Saccharibacteria bacterium]|nr:hypothetical protein [Candidatus Saccharibacteria bacterium]